MSEYILRNGRVIDGESDEVRDLLIQGEKITPFEQLNNPDAETIDCSGKLIFPGVIDPHTHMGIPIKSGFSLDDFASGSKSAIHGGVTSILDFSILEAGQTLVDSIEQRKEAAAQSLCDFGIHCNVTRLEESLLNEIPTLIDHGITSFKVFTTYAEAKMMLSYEEIEVLATHLAKHGGLLMVHAEDNTTIEAAGKDYYGRGLAEAKYHGMSRPVEAEVTAIQKIGGIAQRTGCKVYIVHVSSGPGYLEGKKQGLLMETCPQYLFLDDQDYLSPDGNMFVASPPLRPKAGQSDLWDGLLSEHISTLGTDHCPFHSHDKANVDAFEHIPNGLGGVETSFPLLLAHFLEKDYDLSLLARITSQNSAKIFGLFPQKGSFKPGSDADLIIVDPTVPANGWEKELLSKSDWCAFSNLPAIFPQDVMRRGEWMIQAGKLIDSERGKFLAASIS